MEPGGDLWFWHVLALALGKTVGELQATMSHRELLSWKEFYRMRPFDDLHRYHRPAAVVASSLGGSKDIGKTIDLLVNDRQTIAQLEKAMSSGRFSDADMATFAALGMKPPGV